MTAILIVDILPQQALQLSAGDLAPRDIVAPRAVSFESEVQTAAEREAARDAVPSQYDFSSDKAIAIAAEQQLELRRPASTGSTPRSTWSSRPRIDRPSSRRRSRRCPTGSRATLVGLTRARWEAIRAEAARVLDATLRTELKDDEVAEARTRLAGRMAGDLNEAERMLAADLIRPLLVPNSSFSVEATEAERDRQAAAVAPVMVTVAQNQVIARTGEPLDAADDRDHRGARPRRRHRRCGQLRRLVPAVGPAGRHAARPGCGASGRRSGTATTCCCSSGC